VKDTHTSGLLLHEEEIRTMGNNLSSVLPSDQYSNDFELVIRTSKELEQYLKMAFGADQESLMKKIEHVDRTTSISRKKVNKLKNFVRSK
jgi:hypothetical protein